MDTSSIRQLREAHGITQALLAARLGVTQQAVSKIESREKVGEITRRIYERAILDLAYERMPAA